MCFTRCLKYQFLSAECSYIFVVDDECQGDMKQCLDGTCIPESWLCDGHADCVNGTDESGVECSKCRIFSIKII